MFVLILILLGLIGFLYFFPQRPIINPFDVKTVEVDVPAKELAKIDSLLTAGDSLVQKHIDDSIKNRTREIAYKREIKELRKQRDEIRPEIQPLLVSLPRLAEFVNVQNTIISVQGREIDTLRAENVRHSNSFNLLATNSDKKFKASIQVNEYYKGLAEDRKKDNRKLRRQNTGLKIGFVTLAIIETIRSIKK